MAGFLSGVTVQLGLETASANDGPQAEVQALHSLYSGLESLDSRTLQAISAPPRVDLKVNLLLMAEQHWPAP